MQTSGLDEAAPDGAETSGSGGAGQTSGQTAGRDAAEPAGAETTGGETTGGDEAGPAVAETSGGSTQSLHLALDAVLEAHVELGTGRTPPSHLRNWYGCGDTLTPSRSRTGTGTDWALETLT